MLQSIYTFKKEWVYPTCTMHKQVHREQNTER